MDASDRALLGVCAAGMVIVVLIQLVEIVGRYGFDNSSPARVEIALLLGATVYFAGYSVLIHRGEDVATEYFYRFLPAPARRVLDALIAVAICGFFVLLLVKSLDLYRIMSRMTHPVFPVARSIVYLPIVVGAVACVWVSLHQAWVRLDGLFRPAAAPRAD